MRLGFSFAVTAIRKVVEAVASGVRLLTEAGDMLATEAGDRLITE